MNSNIKLKITHQTLNPKPLYYQCDQFFITFMLYILTKDFESMNLTMYCEGINYSKNILMFHGECKYPNMMQVLHLNSITLLPSMWTTLNYTHLLESICFAWKKCFQKHSFVSWFTILSQNVANIAFLLGFLRAIQYPSKFQKICYGTQRIYGIP